MRIGINEVLIYNRSSGARQRELSLVPALLRKVAELGGDTVIYVARDLEDRLIAQLTGGSDNVTVVRTPLFSIPTSLRIMRGIPYWPRRVKHDRLDIFHTKYYPVPKLGLPTVLTVHDVRFMQMPNTYTKGRYLFLRMTALLSLSRATRIVTVSNSTKADIMRYFRVAEHKIDVVYNPVPSDISRIKHESQLSEVRQRLHLPQNFILCVGHLEPRKNLERLLTAYRRLRLSQTIKQSLVILGKQSFGSRSLIEEMKRSGPDAEVVFTGYVTEQDMACIYSMADALAFPSLHEGFGIPLLEAMTCGVPIVTSNVSALPEVAGDAAVLVNPYSVESIAEGIALVLEDKPLRTKLVRKGFQQLELFNAGKSADALVHSYLKALQAQ